jgi:O-antigen ligase
VLAFLLGGNTGFFRTDTSWRELVFYAVICPFALLFSWTKIRFRLDPLTVSAALLLVMGLLSVFQSGQLDAEGLVDWAHYVLWFGLVLAVSTWSQGALETAYRASVACAIWLCIELGYSLVSPGYKPFLPHPTYLSHFLSLNALMLFNRVSRFHSLSAKSCAVVGLFVLFIGVLVCGTRSSVFALGLAFCFVLRKQTARGRWSAFGVVGIAACVLIVHFADWRLRETSFSKRVVPVNALNLADWDRFSSGRLNIFARTFKMIEVRPVIGWGVGRFPFDYPRFSAAGTIPYWTMHPHNQVLHLLAELGLLGFGAAFLGTLVTAFWIRKSPQILELSGLILILIEWQFSTNFTHPVSRLYFALFLGALLRKQKTGRESKLPNFWKWVCAPIFVLCFSISVSILVSIFYLNQAETISNRFQKLVYVKTAYRFAPGTFAPLLSLTALENTLFFEPSPHAAELFRRYGNMPEAREEWEVAQRKTAKTGR